MKNQTDIPAGHTWLISKMQCVGYSYVDRAGVCFGIAFVGMNAFFSGELEVFSNRLKKLANLPVIFFQDNFKLLKLQQDELIKANEFKQAIELQQFIIEALAFFDGVSLLQSPNEYNALLNLHKKHNKLYQADKDFLQTVTPLIFFKNPELEPTKISDEIIGGYTKAEFNVYLDLLEDYLGDVNFSLGLNIDYHQYTLCYNSANRQWIMIEANKLPPKYYNDSFYLAEDIFENKPNGIIAESAIYAHKKNSSSITQALNLMQQDDRYINIHTKDKENNRYQGYRDGNQMDILISKGFFPTTKMLCSLFSNPNEKEVLSILSCLFENGMTLTDDMMKYALINHHFEIVEWLMYNNICLTNEHLRICIIYGDLTGVDYLINNGVRVRQDDLNFACFLGNLPAIDYLIKKNVRPTEQSLIMAYSERDLEVTRLIMSFGLKMPADILIPPVISSENLDNACLHGKLDEIKIMVKNGLVPSRELFEISLAYGRINVVEYLIDEHGFLPTLKSVTQIINNLDMGVEFSFVTSPILYKILASVDLDPNQSSDYKDLLDTMVQFICFLDKKEIIETLVARGMPISKTMLLEALSSNNLIIANYFIQMGIKPTEEMLSLFCLNGAFDQVSFLIGQGVNPQLVFKEMCIKKCKRAVIFLLENGIIVDDNLKIWIEKNANDFLNLVCAQQQQSCQEPQDKTINSPFDLRSLR